MTSPATPTPTSLRGSTRPAVRVLELGSDGGGIATSYAGWLLAHMGAHVTQLRTFGRATDSDATPEGLALQVLGENKHAVDEPLRSGALEVLVEDCDILLADEPETLTRELGPLASLRDRFPRLVAGLVTTHGLEGPYAPYPGTGLDAQALSGVAWAIGEPGRPPLTLPPGVVEHHGGAALAAGVLAALVLRDRLGDGRIVDIALADVLASYVAGNCRFYVHHGLQWQRSGRRASGSGGAYPFVILPCKDGQVCVCGRTRDEWTRLVHAMGDPPWAAEPRYQRLRAMGTQYPEEVDALLKPWLARHTKAQLEQIALEHNLILSPIREFSEVLETPHLIRRGFFRECQVAQQAVVSPAAPFRVHASREPQAADLTPSLLEVPEPRGEKTAADKSAPLRGIRIIDLGWVWSAPWVGTLLGELGAQVIKVEHAGRPDNLRLAGRVMKDGEVVEGPSREISPMFHQVNHGKLGITLNLKKPKAVELLKRLVETSDIVVENMSPGSLERSGLGYETLRAVNPRIVMLAMSVAGQFGELATMRAYAPTMSSFVGLEALVGYPSEDPIGALNFAVSDPGASIHALIPLFAALRRAAATGEGCYIDFSQIEALLNTLRPYLLDSQVQRRQPATHGNAHPVHVPHGIYPALEDDSWLTLSVVDDEQWKALAERFPEQPWARDGRFASRSDRVVHRDQIDRAIAAWSATLPRDSLVETLRGLGIAATPVLSVEAQWRDPHYAARDLRTTVELPFYGDEALAKAPWRFSDCEPRITRCGPTTGEHNDFVFGELLGLSAQEIAALQAAEVIA